jgi:hypothetical protein
MKKRAGFRYSPNARKWVEVEEPITGNAPAKQTARHKAFAIVPLDDDWGYRAVTAAGRGAAIVLYALYKQRTGVTEVPITAAVLKQCGIQPKRRALAIKKLVESGFATARYHGNKFRGCPLLTLLLPAKENPEAY